MTGFLNSEIAQDEEEQARRYEVVQARTERDLALLRVQMLEALLSRYANRIMELEMQLAMMQMEPHGNPGS